MNLQFKDATAQNIDGKLVYDLTIQDLDGEIAEGRELPFSYIFGQEPTSFLESYINDHIEELKAIVIDESFESELPGNMPVKKEEVEEVDEFTKFFDKAQEKIQEINKRKIDTLEIGVEYKNDMFSSSHESFSFIRNVISYYDSLITKNEITKESVRQKIISSTNTVHIFNYDQLLELQSLMFEKLNNIYLTTNYLKTVSLNKCETSDDIDCIIVDFEQPFENELEVDETVETKVDETK